MSYTPWVSGKTFIDETIGATYYNTALSDGSANVATNARLTIYLRVLMLPNPLQTAYTFATPDPSDPSKSVNKKYVLVPDANSKTNVRYVEVQDWTVPSFEFFKAMVKYEAEMFWDSTELCLVPPPDYRGLDFPKINPTHQLNVDCRFEIVWAKGISDAHIVFWGTQLSGADATNNAAFPSFAGPLMGKNAGMGSIDSGDLHTRTVMSNDIGVAGPNAPIGTSNAIWHEFGHAIGLPHIGVTSRHMPCLKAKSGSMGANHPACSLGPTLNETMNVMGYGDKVSTRNSLPWLLRAPLHTQTHVLDWKVSPKVLPPRKL